MSALNEKIGLVEKKLWELNPSSKQKDKEIESQNLYSSNSRDDIATSDGETLFESTDHNEDTTENSKGRMFFNRLIVCLLAVSLLWMTSLQVLTNIQCLKDFF
jgi:hypothetical protein